MFDQFISSVNETYLTKDAARIKKCFEVLKSPLSEMVEVFDACFASYESQQKLIDLYESLVNAY